MDILLPVPSNIFFKRKKGPLSHFLSTPPLTGRSIPFGRSPPRRAPAAPPVSHAVTGTRRGSGPGVHIARGKASAKRGVGQPAGPAVAGLLLELGEASPQSATRSFSRFLSPRCHRWRRTWASCAVLPDPRPRQRPPPPRSPSLPPPPPYTFPIRPSAAASPQLHHCHVRHKYIPPLSFLFFFFVNS